MRRIVWPLPAAALLALAASAGGASAAGDAGTAKSAADLGGMDELVAAAKRGGRAQRHRAAARLGQLRRDHQGLQRQVRHQGQLGPAGRAQPGRDQRRQAAQGHRPRARRVRPRRSPSRCATPTLFAPYKVGDLGRHPRPRSRTPNGTWVNDYGGYMSIGYDAKQGAGAHERRRPAEARATRARSRSTATRPRPAPRSAA